MPDAGHHVRVQGGYAAFIPAPLSAWPTAWSKDTTQRLEEATHLVGVASGISRTIPNTALLTLASLDKEAIASSTIENTIASPEEFVLFQAIGGPARDATVEVANYRQAMEEGIRLIKDLPICTRLVLRLHEILLNRTSRAQLAGKLKSVQNCIAPDRLVPIAQATFVPPPPEQTSQLLDDLWKFIHSPSAMGKIASIGAAHYQFETIHPFGDGNGRVGRILIVLQLVDAGLIEDACVYPSRFFEVHKDEYIDRLQAVRKHDDLDQWVGFFARAMSESAASTIRLAERIRDVTGRLMTADRGVRRRASHQATIHAFCRRLVLTAQSLAKEAGISQPTAQECIASLMEAGIVREISGKRKGRVYVCQPLFEAIYTD
jgi:Fic family protein